MRRSLRECIENIQQLAYEKTLRELEAQRQATIGQAVVQLAHAIGSIMEGLKGDVLVLEKVMELNSRTHLLHDLEMLKGNVDKIEILASGLLSFAKEREGSTMLEYKNILFCTDFSEDANIAFLHALNLAKKYSAKLHILHVPHSPFTYARHIVDEHVPEEKSEDGLAFFDLEVVNKAEKALSHAYANRLEDFKEYTFIIKCGAPDVEIIRYAKHTDIDLIIMGALGKSDPDRMIHGSTVANVSKYAHCHVMAIRNPAKRFTLPG